MLPSFFHPVKPHMHNGVIYVKIIIASTRRGRAVSAMALAVVGICLLLGGFYRMDAEDASQAMQALANARNTPVYSVATEEKHISVTLNAAEGDEYIEGILDALDEAGVKTTFFALGSWADRYPDALKEITRRGHAVENHSDKHPHMNTMRSTDIRKDIESADSKIKTVTGSATTLFRAPYGEYNDLVVATARDMGYEVIQWSVDSIDWRDEGEDVVTKRVLGKLEPGAIVLLHTDSKGIVPALKRILAGAKEQGYEAVSLEKLLLPKPYTVDSLGVQRAE